MTQVGGQLHFHCRAAGGSGPSFHRGQLIRSGSNDVYLVSGQGVGALGVLRVSPHVLHPLQNPYTEKQLIDSLIQHGVKCPAMSEPVILSANESFPDYGGRTAVLFSLVVGRAPSNSREDFHAWGLEVGKFHATVIPQRFPVVGRSSLDGDLVHRMLIDILQGSDLRLDQRTAIIRRYSGIARAVDALREREKAILCHGDLGPSNVLIEPSKDAALIDFDFSCFATRSFEFALMEELLSEECSFYEANRASLSDSFWSGYRSHHPEYRHDEQSVTEWRKVFRFLSLHYLIWSARSRSFNPDFYADLDAALARSDE